MTDLLLDRITYQPETSQLEPIPWPNGLEPHPVTVQTGGNLPQADCLIVTFTYAEGMALADVLTPGVHVDDWTPYTRNFDQYEPMLTGRSPAKESKRLGSWHATRIGTKRVVCFKSELHPATDGPQLPLARLWQQLIGDARPSLVITTGTAGAVGVGTQLGDVIVAESVRFDCKKQFRTQTWAQADYPTSPVTTDWSKIVALVDPNAGQLPKKWVTRPFKVWPLETTVTTDFFAMGDTTDAYGLLKVAPTCRAVEMDDAACGLALSELADPPKWLSIRNASDPVMDGSLPLEEQSKQASVIYRKWGYTTTIGSAIACWAVVANA